MMFVIAGIIVYWAVMSDNVSPWPGAPSSPLTRMMAGAGPGHSQGFVSSERSHTRADGSFVSSVHTEADMTDCQDDVN